MDEWQQAKFARATTKVIQEGADLLQSGGGGGGGGGVGQSLGGAITQGR